MDEPWLLGYNVHQLVQDLMCHSKSAFYLGLVGMAIDLTLNRLLLGDRWSLPLCSFDHGTHGKRVTDPKSCGKQASCPTSSGAFRRNARKRGREGLETGVAFSRVPFSGQLGSQQTKNHKFWGPSLTHGCVLPQVWVAQAPLSQAPREGRFRFTHLDLAP